MDDRCENNLKSSDRLKQEANKEHTVKVICKIFRKNTKIYVIFNFAIYLLVKYNLFKF